MYTNSELNARTKSIRVCFDIGGSVLGGVESLDWEIATRANTTTNRAGIHLGFMRHPEPVTNRDYSAISPDSDPSFLSGNLHPGTGNLQGENPASELSNGGRHPAGCAFFHHEDHASSAAGAANLGGNPTVLARD